MHCNKYAKGLGQKKEVLKEPKAPKEEDSEEDEDSEK